MFSIYSDIKSDISRGKVIRYRARLSDLEINRLFFSELISDNIYGAFHLKNKCDCENFIYIQKTKICSCSAEIYVIQHINKINK